MPCPCRWFCTNADVDKYPALAGYRGLQDPDVADYFNHTIYSPEGPCEPTDEETCVDDRNQTKKGLYYEQLNQIEYWHLTRKFSMHWKFDERQIAERLNKTVPTLFYLWEPHGLFSRYDLSRIEMPKYSTELKFLSGATEWPRWVLEKVESYILSSLAPDVHSLLSKFTVTTEQQQSMMAEVDDGSDVFTTTCNWLKSNDLAHANTASWEKLWFGLVACAPGNVMVEDSCIECPPGSSSVGGRASACTQCSPGAFPRVRAAQGRAATLLRPGFRPFCKASCVGVCRLLPA